MGGAIGVAVFGSLLASRFSSTMTHEIGGTVPASLLAQVTNNVGQAVAVATQAAPARPFSGLIIAAAKDSFVSGLHLIGVIAAGITLIAAIGVARFLPARAGGEAEQDVTTVAEPVVVGANRP
jgi:hypothetical protein